MINSSRQHARLVLIFIIGVIGLNYPILALFSKPAKWFGIPVLYFYFYIFWLFFIASLALTLADKTKPREEKRKTKNKG